MSVFTPYNVDDDRDYREGSRWPWILGGVFVSVLLVLALGFFWIRGQIDPSGEPGEPVPVRVEEGMSLSEVGELLEERGVITSASIFRLYTRLNGAPSVEAGDFTFRENMSMGDVVEILSGGATSSRQQVTLTVPEGLTLPKIAEKVGELPGRSAEKFLAAAKSGEVRSQYQPAGNNNLEGLLLPETYFLDEADDEVAILRRMVETFDRTVSSLNISTAASRLGITPYQAIVIAAMVEREAKVPEDRGPIARVIYNRLDRDMQLQIDATVLYALGKEQTFVLFSDREVDSPYNTYKIPGLPPGPIASPGKAALEATLAPPPGPWIFYVLIEENGKHAFSTTLEEFNRHVAEARRKGLAG